MAREEIKKAMADLGLTVTAEFVPWSRSRNKDKLDRGAPDYSLNWIVTLKRDGRDILSTDYGAGRGHCPSYSQPGDYRRTLDYDAKIKFECEQGHKARDVAGIKGPKIEPDACDVVYSLVNDGDVLNYSKFEEWASEFGYDPDSRSAEKIYQACLTIALQLRNGIGEAGLAALQTACQDF